MQIPSIATFATVGLAAVASARPHQQKRQETDVARQIEIIEAAAPKSVECTKDEFDECTTATVAAPFIFDSFTKYEIHSPNAQAAIVSLIALESGDLAYKRNHFPAPGRPGQGTANMQMAPFNLEYAQSIPEVAEQITNITDVESASEDELRDMLDLLVENDEYNFASAAWFLRNKCPAKVMCTLAADIDAGFKEYMACVDVEIEETRQEAFDKAKAAFGL